MQTDELISRLSQGLTPVRRVMPPLLGALSWLSLAAVLIGVVVLISGLRHDLEQRLMLMHEQVNMVAGLATGTAAAIAAFHLALPDRSERWALLPLPFAAFWVSGLGWGCLTDFVDQGFPALSTSFGCLSFIIAFGVPMTLGMLWMTRHAARIRPGPVAALAGLAAAAIASCGLTLVHHLDAAAMVLIWHGGSVLLVMLLSRRWGPRALRAMGE
ncbi:NrsF family protein [Falsiroseomonas selenitidurans]|uniref:NrsF family protein n=1 Tax=Falsiroseomonas selenitidurans TaxID=2716335 RepID=UPI00143C9AE5|nr:NrsF family protein [Falsiroseomonas selenitidurans]